MVWGKIGTKFYGKCGKFFTSVGKKSQNIGAKFNAKVGKSSESIMNAKPRQVKSYDGPTISEMAAKQPLALPPASAETVAASQPTINVAKVLGRNLNELNMSQVVSRNGTHIRYYREPGCNKILLKTETQGNFHREIVPDYRGTGNHLQVTQTGGETRYLYRTPISVQQKVEKSVYKDGIIQNISNETKSITNGMVGCQSNVVCNPNAVVKRTLKLGYNPSYSRDISKNRFVKNITKTVNDAQLNRAGGLAADHSWDQEAVESLFELTSRQQQNKYFVNFKDLMSGF